MNMERPIGAGRDGSEQDPRPIVALPSSGLGGPAIAIGCVVAAGILFLILNQQRLAREHPSALRQPEAQISSPPPLALVDQRPVRGLQSATEPAVRAPAVIAPTPRAAPATPPLTWRQRHPVVIEAWPPAPAPLPPAAAGADQSLWQQAPPLPSQMPPPAALDGPAIVQDSGESRQWSGAKPAAEEIGIPADPAGQAAQSQGKARPRPIGDLAQVIAVGTMIEAVLETPIDSTRPGMTRAIVSRSVRSFDGSRVLIPRGGRLVGELDGASEAGGRRVLIKWTQVILPNGVSLDINSPGADASGQAGLDAKSHGGFGRFIGGVLQTAMTFGAAAIGTRGAPIYYAVPLAGGATQLVPRSSGGRRLTVAAGAKINVVVARTLDFSGGRS